MKRIFAVMLLAVLLSIFTFAEKIHEIKETVDITNSVSLNKVREFHTDKDISYTYIKADLSDPSIDLELIKSKDGTDILETVLNLAKEDKNTVAAVNGDFFSYFSGNKGFSLGIEKKDGELIASPINPDTMATVAYDGSSVLMTYLDFHIMVVAPNWQYKEVRHLNKHTTYYGDILMYTSSFNGGYSPAPGGEVVEMVVENGIVSEFRRNMPPVKIPENGCVLVVSEGSTMFLANNFSVGSAVKFDYYITPDLENFDTAFGGGAVIVKDGVDVGKIGDYSHTVSGTNPRTAIGVDKNGTTLYLVTVDGRSSKSSGMKMSELAELMISLGCYTAVNLDGGGSTSMAASTLWDENMKIVNNPTENRKVINAVGITLNETEGSGVPFGIEIKADKEYAFVGQEVKLSAVVYDKNKRKVDVSGITFSCDKGIIENGILKSHVGGRVKVTAQYGSFSSMTYVDYIDNISGISLNPELVMKKGQKHTLAFSVFDSLGRNVTPDTADGFEIVSSNPAVIDVNSNVLTAKQSGRAVVTVSKNGVSSSVNVVCGEYTYNYYNGFESQAGGFVSYPKDVKGAFELTNQKAFSGSMSGKLTYDFRKSDTSSDKDDVSMAVYYALDNPVTLADNCDTVYINAMVGKGFTHSIRAQFTDGNGKIAIVPFTGDIVPDTWRGLAAYIPSDIKRPLTLTRVYVLYTPKEERDKGDVYFDDLSFVASSEYKSREEGENVYRLDIHNSNVTESVRIGAIPKNSDTNPVIKYIEGGVRNFVSSYGTGAFIGEGMPYGVSGDGKNIYLRLDTSKGGIRDTDKKQWNVFKNALSMEGKNLFILSDDDILSKDEFENQVICDMLENCDKNVFVVSCADFASYKNMGNVHYITLDNTPNPFATGHLSDNKCAVEFKIGDKVTFEFVTI